MDRGIISRTIIPAGRKLVGKERGEWVRLSPQEYDLILAHRARAERIKAALARPLVLVDCDPGDENDFPDAA